ncbi:MAG TPA: hypothetical protein VJR58_22005, partial [Vineibacter sp.]|nr:hypothetical protein [Vineibacter sp.]
MSPSQGPGKLSFTRVFNNNNGYVDVVVNLYNFDIDVPVPKDEHRRLVADKVLPALTANSRATVRLIGSASRSGEDNHNNILSTKRATEVAKLFAAVQSQVKDVAGVGEPSGPGPVEDENDRGVSVMMNFPMKLGPVDLWTDTWGRKLDTREIVDLDGIEKNNVQLELQGVPRIWDWGIDPGNPLVLEISELKFKASVGKRTPVDVKLKPAYAAAQPADLSRTFYRLSAYPFELRGSATDRGSGYAIIRHNTDDTGFRLHSWRSHGVAENDDDDIDPLRLLRATGVEPVSLHRPFGSSLADWHMRRPSQLVFYAGSGNGAGCLSRTTECWAKPADLLKDWKRADTLRVVILTAPVLGMTVVMSYARGAPGQEWARLLRKKSGDQTNIDVILGYRDAAPDAKAVRTDVANLMSSRILAGLKTADAWANAWLGLHLPHSGGKTGNAVALTDRGYWYIDEKGLLSL